MALGSFDYPWWDRVRADIEVNPMPPGTRALIEQLLTREEIERPCGGHEQNALARLLDMSLAWEERPMYDDQDSTFRASFGLKHLAARDLLDVLCGDAG